MCLSTVFSAERFGAEIVKTAGVWIQSLFTSATAFFSLFALPLTGQFGWTSSQFSMAYTIYDSIGSYVAGYIGSALLAAAAVALVFAARKLAAKMQETN